MGKKVRKRNKSIFIALEGEREKQFLCYLQEVFNSEKQIKLVFHPDFGGTSNAILDRAIKSPHDKSYAWFDEDDKLDDEHKKELGKRWNVTGLEDIEDKNLQNKNINFKKPIVIVSNPYSVEAIIIQLFDKNLPELITPVKNKCDFKENKKRMKSSVNGMFGKINELEYYKNNLTKELIIKKSKEIYELKLLLTIFDIK